MKPFIQKDLRDFRVKIIKSKQQYMPRIVEFKRRMLAEKIRVVALPKKKKPW